jgi:hypothetical protein
VDVEQDAVARAGAGRQADLGNTVMSWHWFVTDVFCVPSP